MVHLCFLYLKQRILRIKFKIMLLNAEILARKYSIIAKFLKLIMLEAYKPVHWLKIFSSLNFPMTESISVIKIAVHGSGLAPVL